MGRDRKSALTFGEGVILDHPEMKKVYDSLTPRERKVLSARFGINSHEDIEKLAGEDFSVIRQRVKDIETKALKKLAKGDPPDDVA